MEDKTATYEGWAVVELFGHSKEVGYVSTRYFGSSAMFQVDVPEQPEEMKTLERPQWLDTKWAGVGTEYKYPAVSGRTRFVGISSVYALNPCDEQTARKMLGDGSRPIQIVKLVEQKELPNSFETEGERDFDDDIPL